jgi:hypothetical protein
MSKTNANDISASYIDADGNIVLDGQPVEIADLELA